MNSCSLGSAKITILCSTVDGGMIPGEPVYPKHHIYSVSGNKTRFLENTWSPSSIEQDLIHLHVPRFFSGVETRRGIERGLDSKPYSLAKERELKECDAPVSNKVLARESKREVIPTMISPPVSLSEWDML